MSLVRLVLGDGGLCVSGTNESIPNNRLSPVGGPWIIKDLSKLEIFRDRANAYTQGESVTITDKENNNLVLIPVQLYNIPKYYLPKKR